MCWLGEGKKTSGRSDYSMENLTPTCTGIPLRENFATFICFLITQSVLFIATPLWHASHVTANNVTCSTVCEYDDWFDRAHCEERNLDQVPLSTGCEATKMLELQENVITHIDVLTLSGYRHLTTLDVSRNHIDTIDPNSFINNRGLTNILFSRNHIGVLYNYTFNGTEDNLGRIHLTRNKIRNISMNAFRGLRRVSKLYLSHNLIEYLPATLFHDLINVQHLYLSENKLSQIDPSAFEGLTRVRTITLDGNRLSWLPEGLFDNAGSLEELLLADNALTSLPPPSKLGQIEYQLLDLSENNFNTSSSILPYLSISERIYMGGNPFACDCSFLTIQLWYQNISETEREIYEYRRPISCDISNSVYDLLNLTCNKNRSSDDRSPISSTSILPINSSNTTSSTVFEVSGSSERKTTVPTEIYLTEQDSVSNSDSEISDLLILEKKIFSTLVYCAVMITVFFVLWLAKNFHALFSKYTSKQGDARPNAHPV